MRRRQHRQHRPACTNACFANICGDGYVYTGVEACDDGNVDAGDCCAPDCQAAAPDGTACEDGNACTSGATCSGGTCGTPTTCDDGNPCTADICDRLNGSCRHDDTAVSCDDGLFCNGADQCSGGSCGHAGDPCAGGPECDDVCDEATDTCAATAGTPCTDDGEVCTDDQCDGSGACTHPNNTAPCSDGDACTGPDVCSGGACQAGAALDCDDGNACTQDSCVPATGCVNDATPLMGCKSPGKTVLVIKDNADDSKDHVTWKWLKGDTALAEFGDPTAGTEYGLCVFDESADVPNPIFDVTLPPGASWSATGTNGFKYKDTSAAQDGALKLVLRQGTPNKAKAIFVGKGASLDWSGTPLPFNQDSKVIVQLHNSDGQCWESQLVPPAKKNQSNLFKDVEP